MAVSGSHTTTSVSIPPGATSWGQSISSTNTSFSYTVTVAGTYTYQCNPHVGAGMTGSFTASGTSTALHKTSLVYLSMELSPNPVVDILTLKFSSESQFKATMLIFDETGKEKYKKPFEISVGENTFNHPFSSYKPGTYYIVLMEGGASFISKKVVKQ